MADEYGDLIELGFEGLDKAADKYHDKVYGFAEHRKKSLSGRNTHRHPRLPRARPERPEEPDSTPEADDGKTTYAPDRRRDGSWGDDGDGYAAVGRANARDDYLPPAGVRGRDAYGYGGGYQAAPRLPLPPVGYTPRPYDQPGGGRRGIDRRRPSPARRRSSTYSPPSRHGQGRYDSPPWRQRSHSPNRHRATATLVGALAGGLVGNAMQRGGTLTTVAGAIVGGLGAREAEKVYDRRQDRRLEEEGRRERRRRGRERG